MLSQHIGIAVFSIAIAGTLSIFLARQIEQISNNLTEQNRLKLLLEKRVTTTQSLNDDLALVTENEAQMRGALIPVDNILQFIGNLESVANENSVTQEIHFGVPVQYDTPDAATLPVASIDYTATLHGNIFTFMNYLKGIERLPYFAGVTAFTLSATPAQGWKGDSTINVRSKIYVTNPAGVSFTLSGIVLAYFYVS